MERAETILAYQDRVYRLARFVAGDAGRAARLVERAFRRLPADTPDPELALIAALLPAGRPNWPWRPLPAELAASGLASAELDALRRALANASPAARLALGARVLLGVDIKEDAAPLAAQSWPGRAADARTLRAILARDLGRAPPDASYAELLEQVRLRDGALPSDRAIELRAALLADGPAGERARALRDAVARSEERLATALPALFGGPAPAELTERLLRHVAPPERPRLGLSRSIGLQIGLSAIVALAIAAVLLLPRGEPATAPAPAVDTPDLAPAELIERALRRFDQAGIERGVLHERYVAEAGSERWVLERWYGYADPHPLRVEVRDAADQTIFAIASDGRGMLQRRETRNTSEGARLYGVDEVATPEELARLIPILRLQPDGLHLFGRSETYNLDRYYLAQARGAALSDLGAAAVAGRPARLIGFRSGAPAPPPPGHPQERNQPSAQVVLAIDSQTYGLLEVRVLPEADETAGVVQIPWRAEAYAILGAVPVDTYSLPPAEVSDRDERFVSPRLSGTSADMLIGLPEAARRLGGTLCLPPPASGPSVGYAIGLEDSVMLIRESEHEVLILFQFIAGEDMFAQAERRIQRIGEHEYSLVIPDDTWTPAPISEGTIYLSDNELAGVHLIYAHSYASRAEREARLGQILGALRPARPEEGPAMAPEFHMP